MRNNLRVGWEGWNGMGGREGESEMGPQIQRSSDGAFFPLLLLLSFISRPCPGHAVGRSVGRRVI